MVKKGLNIKGLNGFLLMGASALVISACVPEDEVSSQQADKKKIEALAQSYSQAFEHYSNQALNAVANSAAWQAQLLPEGAIDLTESQFGSLNMGNAEAYLSSAHCNVGGNAYHITWFDKADSDGDLFLKGLGAKQSGRVALKVKDIIPDQNFGIMGSSNIEMSDGTTTLSLSGACSSIDIPEGSAVAAIMIPAPVRVSQTQEKLITRAKSCGSDQEGGILERINATFTEDGAILVQGQEFASEDDVIANNALTWQSVSNQCVAITESVTRTADAFQRDAVDMAALTGMSGSIANSLRNNLSDIDCTIVQDDDEETTEADAEDRKVDTCAAQEDLTLLENMAVGERDLVSEETETLVNVCPAQPDSHRTVTIDTRHNDFAGVHSVLHGRQGSFSFGDMTGEMSINKITHTYEVQNDYGGSAGVVKDTEVVVTHQGVDIQCERPNTLAFTCQQMFPEIADSLIVDNGATYERRSVVSGWSNIHNLTPNPTTYEGRWKQNSNMNCTFSQEDVSAHSCEFRGSSTTSFTRFARVTQVGQEVVWSDWVVSGSTPCPPQPCGGGCFVEGTHILMKDGDLKPIQKLVVGDETATGRILLSICNTINIPNSTKNISEHTKNDLYLIDGIKVTGNHVMLNQGKWMSTMDNEDASPHFENNVFNTFNLITENGIIPVIGESGEVHSFADARNNENNESIRGMIKTPLTLSVSA